MHPRTRAADCEPSSEIKILIFALADQLYGLAALQIRQIVAHYSFTPMPQLPACYLGVAEMLGQPVPLIDLRARLGLPPHNRSRASRCVVVDFEPTPIAIQVDSVLRLSSFRTTTIHPPPRCVGVRQLAFFSGLARPDAGTYVVLLDISAILSSLEPVDVVGLTRALEQGRQDEHDQ